MISNEILNFIKGLWPMLVLFVIVICSIRIIDIIFNKKKIAIHKELMNLMFIIYLFLLFQLVTTTDFESYSNNFIPFKEIMRYNFDSSLFFRNVIGNIILFIPFGYLVSYYLKNTKYFIVIILTFITSISTEIIQMYIGRSFDIDDIILNFVGGILGFIIFKIQSKIIDKLPIFLKKKWIVDLLIICLFGIVMIGIYFVLWR